MNIILRTNYPSMPRLTIEWSTVFVLSACYFYFLTILCRKSLLAEIVICIAFPTAIYIYKKFSRSISGRVIQLIMIESTFMLCVILSKICILNDNATLNYSIGYVFRGLFVIQFSLFMLYQYKVKSYLGLTRSLMFLILVIPWLGHASFAGASDAEGRYFFSGVQAPSYIILYYCTWVIGVPLVDSKTLPNFITAMLHFSSVFIALLSQEFFHIRLLTASHLFILDYWLSYSTPKNGRIGVMAKREFDFYYTRIRPIIDLVTLLVCMMIFIYGMCLA